VVFRARTVDGAAAPRPLPALSLPDDGDVLALAEDDGTLYAGGRFHRIARFALGGGQARPLDPVETDAAVQALDLSPEKGLLAAGFAARQVGLYDVRGERPVATEPVTGFDSWVSDVDFTDGGRYLVSASFDQNIYVHDVAARAVLRSLPTPARATSAVRAGDRILTTAQDGHTRAWPVQGPVLERRGEPVYQLSGDDGNTVLSAVGVGEDVITLFDLTGDRPRPLPAPRAPAGEELWFAGRVAPDGSFLAGGTADGDVLVWPLEDGVPGEARRSAAMKAAVTGTDVSADGTTIAAWSETGTAVALLRRDADGTFRRTATLPVRGTEAARFDGSGGVLAAADDTTRITLWDVADRLAPEELAVLDVASTATSVAFSPAAPLMAVGTEDGRIWLFDVSDPARPRHLGTAADALSAVKGLQFSADGAFLAGASGDRFLWLWAVHEDRLQVHATLSASGARMNDVRFVGGARLVSTGDDGVVRSWLVDEQAAIAQICAGRGDPITEEEWARHVPGAPYRELC